MLLTCSAGASEATALYGTLQMYYYYFCCCYC